MWTLHIIEDMQLVLYINRFLLSLIIVAMAGISIGAVFYTKWALYDNPNHIRSVVCQVGCNITSYRCYWLARNYTCYRFSLTVVADIDMENYTRTLTDKVRNYPKVCDKNSTSCSYDDRDVQGTLTPYEMYVISNIVWIFVMIPIVASIVGLIFAITQLKLTSEYIPLTDDVNLALSEMKEVIV